MDLTQCPTWLLSAVKHLVLWTRGGFHQSHVMLGCSSLGLCWQAEICAPLLSTPQRDRCLQFVRTQGRCGQTGARAAEGKEHQGLGQAGDWKVLGNLPRGLPVPTRQFSNQAFHCSVGEEGERHQVEAGQKRSFFTMRTVMQ